MTTATLRWGYQGGPQKARYFQVSWDPHSLGLKQERRSAHTIGIRDNGTIEALGWYCCDSRQYGCAYLGSCTATRPANIVIGHVRDFPEVPYPGKGKWLWYAFPDGSDAYST